MKIIYDFGANNGCNIEYYLKKCDLVVAVEANTTLVEQIKEKFPEEISKNRLIVINCVLNKNICIEDVSFYIHNSNSVCSQFIKPENVNEFTEVNLPSRRASDIVKDFGMPYYIKIDIENYDQEILYDLFENDIFPTYISAESHNIDIFSALLSLGKYKYFNLVDGNSVNGVYSFPTHSAGPFGDDLKTEWMKKNDFFYFLAKSGLGWKDIHATNETPKVKNDT
jgi:FkbM family methyltransferase